MVEKKLSRSVRMLFVGSVAVTLGATSQLALAQENQVQRIEITGSSIKRVDAETMLPITVMKSEDIARTGATTAQDIVNLIPGNFGGGVVSNNVGATGVASTANLRALGSKYTLVLLNGRRLANYAVGNQPVDLNSIPLSAIERIEVLRDGASAIYGADAVAGVINFILKKDYRGLEASVYGTNVRQDGGDTRSFNVTGGFGNLNDQGFNFLLSANHEVNDVLHATDRKFASSANRPDLGINKASPRNGVPNLNFKDSLGNSYTGINPYRFNGCDNKEFALVVRDAKSCGTDYVKFIDLIPKQTHDNVVARAVFQINDDHQVYAEATHTADKMTATYSPAPYTKTMVYPTTGRFYPASITLPKGITLPAGYIMPNGTVLTADTTLANDLSVKPVGPLSGTWRTVAGGGRQDTTETKNDRFMVGAKGVVFGWDYDTSFAYSKNNVGIFFGNGKFSYAKLTPLVASGDINVFGSQDATSLKALNGALLTGKENGGTSTSKELDAHFSKELMQLPYGALGAAFGMSYRQENLNQTSEPVLETGDEVGGGGPVPSVSGDRKVLGLFAETSIPLYKDLEGSIAVRYDNYKNGFGTSFNKLSPKVGLSYKPTKTMMFRTSYGQGYRAPTLVDNLRAFTTGNNTASNFSDPIRCPNGVAITNTVNPVDSIQSECNVQQTTALSGNPALKPEQSKQLSLGFVFQPTSNFSGSLDYWDVKVTGAIATMSENTVFGDPVANAKQIYRYDPNGKNSNGESFSGGWIDDGKQTGALSGNTNKDFPIAYIYLPSVNTGKFFASGLDLNLNYRQKMADVGNFMINFDGTLYTKHGYQYAGEKEVSDLGDYKDFGPTPKWRHALTGSFTRGSWTVSLTHNYTDGYKDFTNPASVGDTNYPAVRNVIAYQTFDATLAWKPSKTMDVLLGIKNLTDRDPPSSRTETNFQTGYDATFTNPLGRTVYLRARYKFM